MSTRDLCVANREAGSPGAATYSTINWSIDTGNGYSGAFQFEDATWQDVERRMGVSWTGSAYLATPAEQTAAFDYWSLRDPEAWPATLPACGGP